MGNESDLMSLVQLLQEPEPLSLMLVREPFAGEFLSQADIIKHNLGRHPSCMYPKVLAKTCPPCPVPPRHKDISFAV